ncbi:MAG TPA: von Willebrand factor type A domain-containing protein [Chitinophagaceae bacterium]|nr:von Willebrand factor type A domain-containing protein [Chitinophagaceae bacterium]
MRYFILVGGFIILLMSAFRHWEGFTINGRVTDEAGNGMPDVSITIKGTKTSTITDATGAFTLKIPGEKAILVVSSVGYVSKEISVQNDGKPVNITLAGITASLQEVVVTGHATVKKKSVAYSSTKISAKQIKTKPGNKGMENALAGKVPGIKIENYSPSIQLRGLVSTNDQYWRQAPGHNTEGYDVIEENKFLGAIDNPLSTFSIDVDAASYSNVRRFLQVGQLPPAGAVRIEEMINYFKYDYPQPENEHPFSINTEIAECPWNNKHKLAMIGLQGKKIPVDNLPPSNLVFLIDVSGSMDQPDKLPLVQASMKLLVDQLRQQDKVAMVVYAGSAGLVLPSTNGYEKMKIKDAIDRLEAGGSTAGGEGIQLAYRIARENFIKEGNNRVILCTDGDFNVGISSNDELERLIEEERKSGVFLTVLGYGTGNYQDSKMQRLADKGNGNHSYIDNITEARKVLVNEFGGTLFTIAKDVKLQIEFNPAKVQAYRLIGYENRILAKEDFNNDQKDAGDLGSGHTVTALYEIIPVGVQSKFIMKADQLKYQKGTAVIISEEMMTIKFRYKKPDEDKSMLLEQVVMDKQSSLEDASENFRFAAAVASFGLVLRNSEFKQNASYDRAWHLAKNALGNDAEGYRSEFLNLLRNAQSLAIKDNKKEEAVSSRD